MSLACDNPWVNGRPANLIGKIEGSDPVLKKQVVVIESYYDSMSVVPTLAPGAEQAGGIASLLELARAFKADPPKRTVWFVACGAHFLGLQGARTYVDQHLEEWQEPSGWDRFKGQLFGAPVPQRDEVLLFSGLDLSSQTGGVGVFYKGNFYDYREDVQGDFADIGRACRENAAKIGQVLGFDPTVAFADGINQINGKGWRNYLPGQFAFDAEVATLAGGKGVTFATTDDSRQRTDTPEDTADGVNVANLAGQTRLLACEYWHLLNDTNDPNAVAPKSAIGVMPVPDWPAWTRQGLRLGISRLTGSVLLFDPKTELRAGPARPRLAGRGRQPGKDDGGRARQPDPGHVHPARLRARRRPASTSSACPSSSPTAPACASARTGRSTWPPTTSARRTSRPRTDPNLSRTAAARGDIDYAPDQGVNGAANYPTEFDLTSDLKNTQVIVFPCVATSIFDLIDQEALKSLTGVTVLDGATDSAPRQYGFVLAGNEPGVSYVEDVAVLFSTPGREHAPQGADGLRPGGDPLPADQLPALGPGQGSAAGGAALHQRPAVRAGHRLRRRRPGGTGNGVQDPLLTQRRAERRHHLHRPARRPGHVEPGRLPHPPARQVSHPAAAQHAATRSTGLHDIANDYIQKAKTALRNKDYDAFDAFSRQAWAYEARVYPQAQATANDVVKGVIFYLFLLIPFAYFMERLLFSKADLKSQVAYAGVIFLIIFGIFSQIHPAFDITINPIIVLIAFVMLALSVIVSAAGLGQVRGAAAGVQQDGVRRPQGRRRQGQHRLRRLRAGHLQHAPPQGAHPADLHHAGAADVHRAVVHVRRQLHAHQRRAGAGDARVPGHSAADGDLGRPPGAGLPAAQRRVRAAVPRRPARLVLRHGGGPADVPAADARQLRHGPQGRRRLLARRRRTSPTWTGR